MKLARKLIITLVLLTLAVLAVSAELSVGRELALSETDMQRDHQLMGRAMAAAFSAVLRVDGEQRAKEFLESANTGESQVHLRWIPISDDPAPGAAAPLDPSIAAALKHGRGLSRVELDAPPDGRLATFIPVDMDGSLLGAIELDESMLEQHRFAKTSILHATITSAVLLVLGAAITGWLGLIIIGQPMRMLVNQARRVAAGDFSLRLDRKQDDEIGELSREMDAMCRELEDANKRVAAETARRIATLEQLRHADRLSTVGKLASGVAHELGTPLNVISGRAKMIVRKNLGETQATEHARIIAEQSERMAAIIRQLLDFARRRDPKKAPIDLRAVAVRTLVLLEPLAQKRKIEMEVVDAAGPPIEVSADAMQIQQVLTNLVVNGIHAMLSGGRLEVEVRHERARPPAGVRASDGSEPIEGLYVSLSVRDEGAGITPEVIGHIFEPFFTTKEIGEGTGLGLSVSYGIVAEHGGWIAVESAPGRGSVFSVYLPVSEGEA